jgi:hypothetical protein
MERIPNPVFSTILADAFVGLIAPYGSIKY